MALSLDATKPRDSYAWNYRKLATLHNLRESLVMSGPLGLQSAMTSSGLLNDVIIKKLSRYNDY